MRIKNKSTNSKPPKFLIIYGIVSFIILVFLEWWFSFNWIRIYNISINTILLISFLFVCFLCSLFYDRKTNKKTKWFLGISLIQLIIITGVSIPITKWQINSSFNKAQKIITQLDIYKEKYKEYPKTLLELEQKMQIKTPKRTNIGTKYQYYSDTIGTYHISFISYFGKRAIYNNYQNRWIMID